MLETKDLCKTYKPKKGVPVMAVDHISLRFPEKGMVFLLGKSGSGKSTMLNLLGGLDQYDDGEIIIKGISSKDFTQQRFDSYRNTYVGFIFQEYNVLEEFTVGANIALALELQGKTATDAELNNILKTVDLEGFGDRKPNELSGGQKQRVAIARALVKNPQIIMADEPTGALDSNTGRQVLDTLKKLSADKLVIIVSHDREYAEQYADRIIELADGKVIRDVEAQHDSTNAAEKTLIFRSSSIEIPADYHLTEEDRQQINAYLDQLRSGASMMLPSQAQRFCDTDTDSIPVQDGSDFSLIQSKLPMKSAFKIGCSSLKHKRFRLVMTILLSVVAFTLFALVDTFGSYDHIRACTDSLIDSEVNYVSVNKSVKQGEGTLDEWWSTYGYRISEAEIEQFRQDTGVPVTGLFLCRGADYSFDAQYDMNYEFSQGDYSTHFSHFCGFAEITQESLDQMNYKLIAGKLPDGKKDEIAVSTALCDTFVKAGYRAPAQKNAKSVSKLQKVTSPLEMVGKVIRIMDTDYTISGVIDTNFDMSRYDRLLEASEQESAADGLLNYLLMSEYRIGANYSLTGAAMVGAGKVQEMIENEPNIYESGRGYVSISMDSEKMFGHCSAQYLTKIDLIPSDEVVWTDGVKTELAENEVIISLNCMSMDYEQQNRYMPLEQLADLQSGKEELTPESLNDLLKQANGKWTLHWGYDDNNEYIYEDIKNAKIVGCTKPTGKYADSMVLAAKITDVLIGDMEGVYDSAVGPMPEGRAAIERFARFCYPEDKDITMRYEMNHPVTYELDTVNSTLKALSKVFFWIGVFFAVFAALLLANFISTSIHYKRQEIGILRAIGSRSADVFRIFFSESFVIAAINFVISAVLCGTGVFIINTVVRKVLGVLITVLHFGIRQVVLLAIVSVLIAAVASFIPVYRIASKRPIDAIRDK